MSKSIYEEADLILNGRIADGEVKSFKVTGTTYCKITNALKQAKKQEKVLELYKEINNKRKELITLSRHNTWSWKLDIEIREIQDKIKENENEENN